MLGLLFFRGVCVCLAESRFYSAPQVFFYVRVHSSVQEEVKEEGFAFLPVAVEFLGWIASQLSCESRWPCWGSTASCGDFSSASSTSTAASATASATATASA